MLILAVCLVNCVDEMPVYHCAAVGCTNNVNVVWQEYFHLPISVYAFLISAVVRELFLKVENWWETCRVWLYTLMSLARCSCCSAYMTWTHSNQFKDRCTIVYIYSATLLHSEICSYRISIIISLPISIYSQIVQLYFAAEHVDKWDVKHSQSFLMCR